MSAEERPGDAPKVAVALRWEAPGAPIVVAKGEGELAERILETARAHDVAIEENPLLAGALAAVELDHEIPEAMYRAVAEIIAFVLRAAREPR